MNSRVLLIPARIFLLVFAVISSYHAQSQKAVVDKKVKYISETNHPDSTRVIVKTIKTDKSGTREQEMNMDSLIQVLCSGNDSTSAQIVKTISIHNGDTVVKECHSANLDSALFHEINPEKIAEEMLRNMQHIHIQGDSVLQWTANFDSLVDPLNVKTFEIEWTGQMNEMDSIMEHALKVNADELETQMIFISENGEEIRIEKQGEMVFINKKDAIDSVESEIKVIKNKGGKKVIVLETRIELAELTESEKSDLKSKGLKTGTKEPEFDYLKFFPNPSEGSVNIEFRTAKPVDTEIRITNMIGKILFEEKINDFSGEYNKAINLIDNGKGTYLLQIVQGKKVITRKIIVD